MAQEFVARNGIISKNDTLIQGGLTANTISATTYYNLPINIVNTSNLFSTGLVGTGAISSVVTNSIFFGVNAGFQATGASNSNFFGESAGHQAKNANKSNFLGDSAGSSATNANNSNFFGSEAGNSAINAHNSNFIGQQAGNGATDASNSNFIGNNAGFEATGADNSNFIGNNAGFEATDASGSNFLGQNAGNGANGASVANFLGIGAGSQATGASGSNFLGYQAGFGAANANDSNFLGQEAGNGATDANNSNFIGAGAGSSATGAEKSNFLGQSAGLNATSAYQSNFFGQNAGQSATNANDSNFLGQDSGSGATGANNSNFIGKNAGKLATGANSSNFLGQNSGNGANGAGSSNFLGISAGYQAPNANYSNFFGTQTGYQATGVSYSNLFGYKVGFSYTGNNIGSNNIIIGTNISLPNARVNGINIGGVLFGTGTYSATSGNPSITGQTQGKIGINVVTPTEALHVSGNTLINGNLTANTISGTQLKSSITTGTPPLTVSSTTIVTNLNADYLDGQHGTYYQSVGATHYIGTTSIANDRASATQTLAGVSIDGNATSANRLPITGYGPPGNSVFTFNQTESAFAGRYSGWASYLISNHVSGETYFNQTLIMPFYSAPQYSRLVNGTQSSLYNFWTSENLTTPITGTGITGYIPKFTGATALGNSQIFADGTNVGIGNTTPRSLLHLGSNAAGSILDITFQLGYSGDDFYGYRFVNTSNPSLTRAGLLRIQRGTNAGWIDTLTINNDGNIGIGTTATTAPLQIGKIYTDENSLYRPLLLVGPYPTTNVRSQNLITFLATDNATSNPFSDTTSENQKNFHIGMVSDTAYKNNNRFSIIQNGLERFTIVGLDGSLGNGNVGIGTITPADKLTIVGSASTTFHGGGIYNTANYTGGHIAESRFNLGKIENTAYQPMGAIGGFPFNTGDSTNGILAFYTRSGQTVTEKMRIMHTGNVGIGTTSPTSKLHVSGNTLINGNLTTNTISATTYQNLPEASASVNGIITTGNQTIAGTKTFNNTIIGSINGTATNISNTGTVTLASETESNSITITQPSFTTNEPVKLLNFNWYNDTWSLSNIRSGNQASNGLGVFLNSVEKFRFTTTAFLINGNTTLHSGNYTSYLSNFTGGTVSGATKFTGGLTANTISATTYLNLPIDVRVTGGTYSASAGTVVFTNNTGGTFNVSGFSTSTGGTFTGGTVSGATRFTGGLTANTISATTYLNLPASTNSPITVVNNSNLFSTAISGGLNASGVTNSIFFGEFAGSGTDASGSNFFGYGAGSGATSTNNSNFFGINAGKVANGADSSNFLGQQAGQSAINANKSNFFGDSAGKGATGASYSNLFGYNVGNGTNGTGNNIGSNNIIIGTNISLPNARANSINIGGVLFGSGTYSATSGNPSIIGQTQGKIGINCLVPTEALHVSGNTLVSGNVTALGFFNSSDGRLKDIISRDGDTVKFTWKDKRDEKKHIGYIAQEIQEKYPDQVNNNDDYLTVNYIEILVAKIQELENRIKILEK